MSKYHFNRDYKKEYFEAIFKRADDLLKSEWEYDSLIYICSICKKLYSCNFLYPPYSEYFMFAICTNCIMSEKNKEDVISLDAEAGTRTDVLLQKRLHWKKIKEKEEQDNPYCNNCTYYPDLESYSLCKECGDRYVEGIRKKTQNK